MGPSQKGGSEAATTSATQSINVANYNKIQKYPGGFYNNGGASGSSCIWRKLKWAKVALWNAPVLMVIATFVCDL